MRSRFRKLLGFAVLTATSAAIAATPALADFPYSRPGADTHNFNDLYLTNQDVPNDLSGDGNTPKFAATPDPDNTLINSNPVELGGVRGAHLADANHGVDTGMQVTTGRPDVTIAVLDSGIKWNDAGAMADLRKKVHLRRQELPAPQHLRTQPLSGSYDCSTFADAYDANGDGVFNVEDYACDTRVNLSDSRRAGRPGVLVPQDLIIAFSDGAEGYGPNVQDSNGFVDDIAGWDFLDNDNDPFDDVQYGHGTGEARDSSSEGNNGGQLGACPNCMVIPLRVGESFIADVNRFAQAVLYATDNGVDVVQEALGTLNNSSLARDAVDYAYRHGTTVIASAADEAAQHNNWPSSLPHVIVVNSVTDEGLPAPDNSYLAVNGCTNFNAKITLAIPSTSCSSNATGLGAGMAGLIYSAAMTAHEKGQLPAYSDSTECQRVNGDPCLITPNEVRQLMASGTIGGQTMPDDVNFAGTPAGSILEPTCSPLPLPTCTDPNVALQAQVDSNRPAPFPASRSYPARFGHDQFYGYGRVNMARTLRAVLSDPASPGPAKIPPDVEINSPQWFEQVNPTRTTLEVDGHVDARTGSFTCQVLVAPGHYPNNRLTTDLPPGDFKPVPSTICDGTTSHGSPIDGKLADLNLADLRSRFPAETQGTAFAGREPVLAQTASGRPNSDPYGFTVKVVAKTHQSGVDMAGEDYRAAYLHRDQDMLSGFPMAINDHGEVKKSAAPTGDGESSPAFADLNGDNRNEMIFGSSDGFVHALQRDGTELPGWPVRTNQLPLHTGGHAFSSGAISTNYGGAMLASMAVGDANRDGIPEVYGADIEGNVYGWSPTGQRVFHVTSNPDFSGAPLPGHPFENPRYLSGNPEDNRIQHGFISSPVLADLDGDGRLEIVEAGMDRHLYAWHLNGDPVSGFPVLVIDPSKVQSVAAQSEVVTFKANAHPFQQGAIVDTPAIANLGGDARPEIVLGTNEEYDVDFDGGFNAAPFNTASLNILDAARTTVDAFKSACGSPCDPIPDIPIGPANSRLYAVYPDGTHHSDAPGDSDAFLAGWPAKIGILTSELLPDVGEGITAPPAIGPVSCPSGGSGPKIGVLANNGPVYVLNANGTSCYGQISGHDIPLQSDVAAAPKYDTPALGAVGTAAFGDLGGPGLSLVAPAAGLLRALDVALPDYQGGQDFTAAWDATTGQFRPGFPAAVNDLQFLTGPSVADIDGLPGEEVLEGTASMDFAAFNALGLPASLNWPKLSTDWTVANPLIGSWGTTDTDAGAKKVVVNMTRSGYINAYGAAAGPCTPSSWPRFHHDNANSGYYDRDAVAPGKPTRLALTGVAGGQRVLSFVAPGDDLLCGTAHHFLIAQSDTPIDDSNFSAASALGGPPAPSAAGTPQSFTVPAGNKRYVAIRAVDDQGNVGREASIDTAPGTGGGGHLPGACANKQIGTAGNDRLVGSRYGDLLLGLDGNDELLGLAGKDCDLGGAGNDRLTGDDGADTLAGQRGDDRLLGGAGKDTLRGGLGNDFVRGGDGKDVLRGGDGNDTIVSRDGVSDVVRCGGGSDSVRADSFDDVGRYCEHVRRT